MRAGPKQVEGDVQAARGRRAAEAEVEGRAMGADRLQRFSFFSTAFVSGTRRGVVLEEELERGQSFRTPFESTKYQAEQLVRRAARDLPVSIFRPSLVVGHTLTGEFDQSEWYGRGGAPPFEFFSFGFEGLSDGSANGWKAGLAGLQIQ